MTKVSYHPGNSESDETEQFGYSFAGGKPTEVKDSDGHALAKFAGNRFFKVHEKKEAKSESGLKAVHVAGGRFVIKKDGDVVKEGLNKADADAFNGMSDEDKAAYVDG
ncbi:hypothetical protein ACQZ46_02605 [Agrobacterium salinitolerans]